MNRDTAPITGIKGFGRNIVVAIIPEPHWNSVGDGVVVGVGKLAPRPRGAKKNTSTARTQENECQ